MNEIAVIRRSAEESRGLLDALRAAFPVVVDVHAWEQVRVVRVDSTGQITATLAGAAMDELRAVFHLGAPTMGTPTPTREQHYVQQEREHALLAALATCRHTKLVNRGAVLAWNRGPHEPSGQLRLLARLGWRTPRVVTSFDLATGAVARLRDPEPDAAAQELIVVGLRRHVRVGRAADAPDEAAAAAALEPLVARTQLHLRDHRLDLCTLPVAWAGGAPVAYGLHVGATAEAPRDALVQLLREAVS